MPLSEINGVGNTKKKTVNETMAGRRKKKLKMLLKEKKNIICPTSLSRRDATRRKQKLEEILFAKTPKSFLCLWDAGRRKQQEDYCQTTSPVANKNNLKVALLQIPLNKNSCYALQNRSTLLFETLLHLTFTIFNAMMTMSAKSLERKSGVFEQYKGKKF